MDNIILYYPNGPTTILTEAAGVDMEKHLPATTLPLGPDTKRPISAAWDLMEDDAREVRIYGNVLRQETCLPLV